MGDTAIFPFFRVDSHYMNILCTIKVIANTVVATISKQKPIVQNSTIHPTTANEKLVGYTLIHKPTITYHRSSKSFVMSSTGSPPKKRKNNHHPDAPAVIEIIDLIDEDDDNKKPAASAHRNNKNTVIDLVTESNTRDVSSKVAVAVLDLTAATTTTNTSTNNNTEYNIVVEMQRVWTTTPGEGGAAVTTTHSSSAMYRDDDTGGDNTGDEAFARKLQAEDDWMSQIASPRQEQRRMMETIPGRAVLFVERIIRLVDEMNTTTNLNSNSTHPSQHQHTVEPVTKDDMVYFAERLLRKQEEFQLNGIPFQVCIGYHYTNDANMQKIRENGLMTRQERTTNQVVSANTHGSVFGDGIYTGTCVQLK